ncbi:MAG: HAD family hydrolase [Clostridiales bacterium]|jgi:phosphoglycolate phosphatase-like HAD superfamily hydrolase|nr:HAD family hydrolase [Clostridiales bacterium]
MDSFQALSAKKLVIFDLDGTIVDNAETFMSSYRYAIDKVCGKDYRLQNFPDSLLQTFVEKPLEPQLRDNGMDEAAIKKIRPIYDEHKFSLLHQNTPIPKMINLIKDLHEKGVQMAIVTHNSSDLADSILNYIGMREYFIDISGRDAGGKKSDRIIALMKKHGISSNADAAYIGNMQSDQAHAKTAGVDYKDVTDFPNKIRLTINSFPRVKSTATQPISNHKTQGFG